MSYQTQAKAELERRKRPALPVQHWPGQHVIGPDEVSPVPFHLGQRWAWESERRTVAIIAGTQSGKALALDEAVPTPEGFKEVGSLQEGDLVFGVDGKPYSCFPTEVYEDRPCYRVTFDDGASLIVDGSHWWRVQSVYQRKNQSRQTRRPDPIWATSRPQCRRKDRYSILTTEQIAERLFVRASENDKLRRNYSIDMPAPARHSGKDLPIPPYTFGAWLGDGTASSAGFTCADHEIVEHIRAEGIDPGKGYYRENQGKALSYSLGSGHIRNEKGQYATEEGCFVDSIRKLGVKNNKHIPDIYLHGSIEQRLELLRGLMDTDGSCYARGKGSRCEFCSVNNLLAQGVLKLCRSLGIKARLKQDRAKLNGKDCGPRYRVFFTTDMPVFYVKRKASRLNNWIRRDMQRRFFDAVESVESRKVRCLAVPNAPHNLFLAGRDYIPTHNTTFGPWWLAREIEQKGRGDYLAITSVYDLFKMKMLPALRQVFEKLLPTVERDDGLLFRGRYWAGDRVIEICDPETGKFLANRSDDLMWARIILRSADAKGGLEAGTVKAAWLDEAGQDRFTVDAYKGIRRRLAIHQGRQLITTTLYNLGWVKSRVIDKAEDDGQVEHIEIDGAELDKTDNAGADVCLIQLDSIVNPSYPRAEYEAARDEEADDEFQMQWRGRVTQMRDLIYPQYETCPRFPIPETWKRYMGMDYGPDHTAAIYFAEDPDSRIEGSRFGRWYAYREYLDGGKTCKEHTDAILENEPGRPVKCVGGTKSEKQWHREFIAAGLPTVPPPITDVWLGIRKVRACNKTGSIVYFDDLDGIIDEKGKYRRKRDRSGQVTNEIKDKNKFHRMDAERYIIAFREASGQGWAW